MSTVSEACQTAFTTCHSYQTEAGVAISNCAQDPLFLTSRLKSLIDNKYAVDQAQQVLKTLVGLPGRYRQQKRQSQYQCSNVIDYGNQMLAALSDNPSSLEVKENAELVVNRSADVVCSQAEIIVLANLDSSVTVKKTLIDSELVYVQTILEGEYSTQYVCCIYSKVVLCSYCLFSPTDLTGSTASPQAIAAAPGCVVNSCDASYVIVEAYSSATAGIMKVCVGFNPCHGGDGRGWRVCGG